MYISFSATQYEGGDLELKSQREYISYSIKLN
jgi:hypothetical protein